VLSEEVRKRSDDAVEHVTRDPATLFAQTGIRKLVRGLRGLLPGGSELITAMGRGKDPMQARGLYCD
jgi:hypothetical protein